MYELPPTNHAGSLLAANFYLLKPPLCNTPFPPTLPTGCWMILIHGCTCAIPVPPPQGILTARWKGGRIFVKLCIAQGYLMGACQRAGGNMTSFQGKYPRLQQPRWTKSASNCMHTSVRISCTCAHTCTRVVFSEIPKTRIARQRCGFFFLFFFFVILKD